MDSKGRQELDSIPKEYRSKFTIDNNGNLVFKNRAYRRQKQPTNNWETKNTHAIAKKRKNIREKTKHNRRSTQA